jgi:hypothetical protein
MVKLASFAVFNQQTVSGSRSWHSLPTFQVTSVVPEGSVLEPFLFTVFINALCNSNKHCKVLIFTGNLKIFRIINSPYDRRLLQSDINSVSDYRAASFMRLETAKTRVISYSRKANLLRYGYQLCHAAMTSNRSIKELGVSFDSKLYFHNHVDLIF